VLFLSLATFKEFNSIVKVGDTMDFEKLFALAKPYLEKNELGAAHTSRFLL